MKKIRDDNIFKGDSWCASYPISVIKRDRRRACFFFSSFADWFIFKVTELEISAVVFWIWITCNVLYFFLWMGVLELLFFLFTSCSFPPLDVFCLECKYFSKGQVSACDPKTQMRNMTFYLKKGVNCPPTQVYRQNCTQADDAGTDNSVKGNHQSGWCVCVCSVICVCVLIGSQDFVCRSFKCLI